MTSKRKLLPLLALLGASAVQSQDVDVWACIDSRISGLKWENTRWVADNIVPSNFLLVLNGIDSSVSINGDRTLIECARSILPQIVSCNDILGTSLLFNTVTHLGTLSSIIGGVIGPGDDGFRDPILVKTFRCNPVDTGPDEIRP